MPVITEKLQLLKCPKEMYDNAFKFVSSLTVVTPEEIKEIIDYLKEKGIAKEEEGKPLIPIVAFQILPLGLTEIKKRVEQMESLGHIGCYVEKPARINIKDANLRVAYVLKQGDPVINEKGKYVKLLFDEKLFKDKYGEVDLTLALSESAPIENMTGEIDKPVDFGETIPMEGKETPAETEMKVEQEEDPFAVNIETGNPVQIDASLPAEETKQETALPQVPEVTPPAVENAAEPTQEVVSAPVPDATTDVVIPPAVENAEEPTKEVVSAPVPDATTDVVTPPAVENAAEPTQEVVSAPVPDATTDVVIPPAVENAEEPTKEVVSAPVPDVTTDETKNQKIEYILSGLYPALFGLDEVPTDMLESAKSFAATSDKSPEDLVFELVTMGSSYDDAQKQMIKNTINDIAAGAPSIGGR